MLRPGSRIGKLKVVSQVASGGRSELFLARASEADGDQTVMLKQLRARSSGERAFETFVEEARIATLLSHPSVVRPQDVGEYDGHYFFTMEYVDGGDVLSLASRSGGMPVSVALTIVAEAARALHDAHEKRDLDGQSLGIVHRNLSPDNILVSRSGDVKLIDFGHEQETREKVLRGEISYLAPEQCLLELVDRRADVFALGILLWELTTGARLFAGENERVLRRKVCIDPIALPSAIRADYPPALEAIVMHALERNPGERFSTCKELAEALEDFARSSGQLASRSQLSRFVQEVLSQPAVARPELARSSQQLSAVSTSPRAQRPVAVVNAATARPASAKQKGRSRLTATIMVAVVLAAASFAVASYVLPRLEQSAKKSASEAAPAANDEPAVGAAEEATAAGAAAEANDEPRADGPISVDDVLAKPAVPETRAARRANVEAPKSDEPEAGEPEAAEPTESRISNFEAEVKKRRTPRARSSSRLANFEAEVEKRKKPRQEEPKASPAKKPSAASALLPSQR